MLRNIGGPRGRGAMTILNGATQPSRREMRGDLVWMLCARTVAYVQGAPEGPLNPNAIRPRASEHVAYIRRLCCPHCSGRLLLQNTEDVYLHPRRSDPDDDGGPRRGRPPRKSA